MANAAPTSPDTNNDDVDGNDQTDQMLSREMEKQQQLSDWYYIKSNPKSPRLPPRPEKRTTANSNAKYSPALRQREHIVRNYSSTNIYHSLNNNNHNHKNNHNSNKSESGSLKRDRYDEPRMIAGGGDCIGRPRDSEIVTGGPGELSGSSNNGYLFNQVTLGIPTRCDERKQIGGKDDNSLLMLSLDRKRREHREPSPIYQHINQHAAMQQSACGGQPAMSLPLPPQRLALTAERKVPEYENHQIVSHFHQAQHQQHPATNPNYRSRNRTANVVDQHNHNHSVNNNNSLSKTSLLLPQPVPGLGELTTTGSFLHVNVSSFIPEITSSAASTIEKQYRSTGNFIQPHDYSDESAASRKLPIPPRRRLLPPISYQPSPDQTVSLHPKPILCLFIHTF